MSADPISYTERSMPGMVVKHPPEGFAVEEERIRSAYGKRTSEDPRYSWFDPGYLFMMQDCHRRALDLLKQYGLAPLRGKRILDLGCGTGSWIRQLILWGARPQDITGSDLLPDRVAVARQLSPSEVVFRCESATDLTARDAEFDLVIQTVVFSSVLAPEVRREMAREMLRVLKPGGVILWYDFLVNNPRNPDVQGVPRQEIHRLFPQCQIDLRRITLAPPLVRWLAPRSWLLSHLLSNLAPLCTHYLGIIRKASVTGSLPAARG